MRVLIASHACVTSSNQRLFALAAQRRGWDVTLLLPSNWVSEYGSHLPAVLWPGFEADLVTAPVWRSGSVPLHVYRTRLGRLIRRVRPDLIYSHNEPYALSTVQLAAANACTLGRPFGFFSCQNLVKWYPPPFAQAERWVYRTSRFALPISEAVDRVHRTKGYRGPSTVVSLGFDAERYRPSRDVRARHLRADGVASGPCRFAYVGRFVEEKGLRTLFAALARLSDAAWLLDMVGAGPLEPELRAIAADAGFGNRVGWRGFISQEKMPALYEACDALILPSESRRNWTEQFGRVLVEAMACGTPTVGSSSGEIPAVIAACGGGLAFPELDSDALAQTLRRLIENPHTRADLAEAGVVGVRPFAITVQVERFTDALEAACG